MSNQPDKKSSNQNLPKKDSSSPITSKPNDNPIKNFSYEKPDAPGDRPVIGPVDTNPSTSNSGEGNTTSQTQSDQNNSN